MKKKRHDIDPWLQEWERYNQQANLASNLSEETLKRLFTDSQKMPPVPIPPLPPDPHHVPRFRFAAAIVLIVVGAVLLLLSRSASDSDTPLQAQHATPANITLPAAEPHSTPPATHSLSTPRHVTVAKAKIKTDNPSSTAVDNPLPETATPSDPLSPPNSTFSTDNLQFVSLCCNSETCDTQRFLYQILAALNLA